MTNDQLINRNYVLIKKLFFEKLNDRWELIIDH